MQKPTVSAEAMRQEVRLLVAQEGVVPSVQSLMAEVLKFEARVKTMSQGSWLALTYLNQILYAYHKLGPTARAGDILDMADSNTEPLWNVFKKMEELHG